MLKKIALLAVLAFATTALNAIELPQPSCWPCPEEPPAAANR